MSTKLPDYLRACRKRAGLSQNEVAILAGFKAGATISRLEYRQRTMSLDAAIAYMIVFDVPLELLIPKRVSEVGTAVSVRAERLLADMAGMPHGPRTQQRIEFLRSLEKRVSLRTQQRLYERQQG